MIRLLLASVLLASLSVSGPVWADDQAELDALRADIAKLQRWLNEASDEHGKISAALGSTDQEIAELAKKIEATKRQLGEEQTRLKKLRREQQQLGELQARYRLRLKQQLRAAYQVGNEGAIKLLLNQDDPQYAQRMLTYFRYFNRARMTQIESTIQELDKLARIEDVIHEQETRLQKTQTALRQQRQSVKGKKQQQKKLLVKLQQQIRSSKDQLKQKKADRQRLEKLLDEIRLLVENSARKDDARPFKSLKRKLPRPLDSGRILHAFGQRNHEGVGRWQGWMIRVPEGTPVKAVHHGQVVYSGILRGLGLLMIVDHGDDYLTLYAHNQALLYPVGSWVNQGEVIASSGQSGGIAEPRLYFEIRYKGRPQDPAAWLKR
jgi:septal ring factor EnvC (AmiA/AmiB activator)